MLVLVLVLVLVVLVVVMVVVVLVVVVLAVVVSRSSLSIMILLLSSALSACAEIVVTMSLVREGIPRSGSTGSHIQRVSESECAPATDVCLLHTALFLFSHCTFLGGRNEGGVCRFLNPDEKHSVL